MVPAPHHQKRAEDPDGTDFTSMRIPGPRQWKKVFFWISSIATFVGTLWMVNKEPERSPASPERTAVLERSVRMEGKIDDLTAAMNEVQAEHAQFNTYLRGVIQSVAKLERAKAESAEHAEERHAEIMSLLTEFKEKGVRRK